MDTNSKRYLKEIGSSMAAYTAMVPVSIWLLKNHEHSPLRYLFAALPVNPSAFAMWPRSVSSEASTNSNAASSSKVWPSASWARV